MGVSLVVNFLVHLSSVKNVLIIPCIEKGEGWMSKFRKLWVCSIFCFFLLLGSKAYSASPVCHTHSSGNYCSYTGFVKQIYVNTGGVVLLYFDSPVDVGVANSFGMNITNGRATAYGLSDNPEFAKLFYSTALAAQATNRQVTLLMRGNFGAYLKFDRIWLSAPN